MYKTIPARHKTTTEEEAYWVDQCKHSNSLYNSTMYYCKQRLFEKADKENKTYFIWTEDSYSEKLNTGFFDTSYAHLCEIMKSNEHYRAMPAQSAQQTVKKVHEALMSYNGLLRAYFKSLKEGTRGVQKPGLPNYRKSGGLFEVTFVEQTLKYIDGLVVPQISQSTKDEMICELGFQPPSHLPLDLIKEVQVMPIRGEFCINWVIDDGIRQCQMTEVNPLLNQYEAISIDPGVKNWMTVVSTQGKSFIVDGQKLRNAARKYRDAVKRIKAGKPDKYWDHELDYLTHKFNKVRRDAINKACRFLINHCLQNGIGIIVFGRNPQMEQNINIGKGNNYDVTQMPIARVITRLEQLCSEYGIRLVVTEESYSSRASFLDGDSVPVYGAESGEIGAKPDNWKPSGRRVKRGLYKTSKGLFVNADCNGAANILSKVAKQLGISLAKVVRGIMTVPHRYDIFADLSVSYRKAARAALESAPL